MYNNQNTIHFKTSAPLDIYDYLFMACAKLNGVALKLYIYFIGMTQNEDFAYAPNEIIQAFGCSRSSLQRGFQELIDKNYLRQEESNYYIFCNGGLD